MDIHASVRGRCHRMESEGFPNLPSELEAQGEDEVTHYESVTSLLLSLSPLAQ